MFNESKTVKVWGQCPYHSHGKMIESIHKFRNVQLWKLDWQA